ncbi:MAG: VTT domain-containing protein [Actinomycetota bacterium]|nr:VTT domain-containing protein [Actinomycetota bacterium]
MTDERRSPTEARHEREGVSRAAILISLAGLLAIVLVVLVVEPLRSAIGDAVSGDTESLREDLRGLGAGGVALVIAIAIAHSVIFYPAEILNAASGYVYGFWAALPLMMLAWLLNGIVCFFVGRHAARPGLLRVLGEERFVRYEGVVERGGATLLLSMRLIPIIPFSLFSYVAGSADVPFPRFVWTTVVGYLPITVLFIYLGSRLEELSLTDPFLWAGAVALVAGLLLTRRLLPTFSK